MIKDSIKKTIDFGPPEPLGPDSSISLRLLLRKPMIWNLGAPWSGQVNFINAFIKKIIDFGPPELMAPTVQWSSGGTFGRTSGESWRAPASMIL